MATCTMHPLRHALHNEPHARPSIYFDQNSLVFHLALIEQDNACEVILERLYQYVGTPRPNETVQGLLRLDGHAIKWERHSEFLSLTLVVGRSAGQTFEHGTPPALTKLIAGHETLLINSTQVLVEQADGEPQHHSHYGFKDPAGSTVGGGDATVWSDFKLADDGSSRLLIINRSLNAYRLGRMVRRLLEIETYRMMASLALPVAKEMSRYLKELDQQLTTLSDLNADNGGSQARSVLHDLSRLSALIVRLNARHKQRFSATEAYAQLVFERIAELREGHLGDCQRLGVFIERRFKPSVRYCRATQLRLEHMNDSVAYLSELLQARIQVDVEEQNSAILRSLNARATAQMKIQRAVEGLSIIAISYYMLSLFKLLYEGLHSLGFDLQPREAALYLGPLAVLSLGAIAMHILKIRLAASER